MGFLCKRGSLIPCGLQLIPPKHPKVFRLVFGYCAVCAQNLEDLHCSAYREFKLCINMSNGKCQAKKNRLIKSELTCCFNTTVHNYSFDAKKTI